MIYLFLADGFEEVEALAPYDILKRAKQEILKVGVTGEYVESSHGVKVKCDALIDDVDYKCDMAILPGGMPGTTNLDANEKVKKIVRETFDAGKTVGAICAAPMILGKMGLLEGKRATCFPGFEEYLKGARVVKEYFVRDGNIVTGRGAGASLQFGFELLRTIDVNLADEIMRKMQYVL